MGQENKTSSTRAPAPTLWTTRQRFSATPDYNSVGSTLRCQVDRSSGTPLTNNQSLQALTRSESLGFAARPLLVRRLLRAPIFPVARIEPHVVSDSFFKFFASQ